MFINILQLILVLVTFIVIKLGAWYVTEKGRIPEFLHYEPYICYRCLGFWLLTALYMASGLVCHLWLMMSVGMLITILDTIALTIHIKNNTVKIDLTNE